MKVAPDGRTLYGVIQGGVVPINLVNGNAGSTIDIPGAAAVAISPDGGTAYVVTGPKDTMTVINLASRRITRVISLHGLNPANRQAYYGIALAPDGQTAYVVDGDGGIFPMNLMTGTISNQISVSMGTMGPIVVTPDGQTAYVITGTGGNVGNGPEFTDVASVDLATGSTVNTISVPNDATDIGISPDGRFVYVTTEIGVPTPHSFLVPIDVATSKLGKPERFNGGSLAVAVAPIDGS